MKDHNYEHLTISDFKSHSQSTTSMKANMSDRVSLKWTSFQKTVEQTFGNMRKDEDFTDVSLACEDGQQFEAHKVVLAASGAFFQNILKNNKKANLLIFLGMVKSEYLE